MKLFSKIRQRKGVERATPEVSKRFLEETIARDEIVNAAVSRNSREVKNNHLGPRMHRALRGF